MMRRSSAGSALLGLLLLAATPGAGAENPAPCTPAALDTPVPIEPLNAVPCVNGFAGPYPCSNVDLMSHLPLAAMGCGGGNSLWGWTDPLDGKEYALMGCDNGISFVDISTPDAAVYLGRLPTHEHDHAQGPEHEGDSLWRDVRVYANHAFVVSEQPEHQHAGLRPHAACAASPAPGDLHRVALYEGVQTTHTIAINEETGFAYAAGTDTCNGGLHMINIQDPLNPTFAGCVANDDYTHETQCVVYSGPDADYVGHEICFSSNIDTLTIVDVTDKSAPVQISRTGYEGSGYTHQGWLTARPGATSC